MNTIKKLYLALAVVLVTIVSTNTANAQVEVSTGADIYSTYVWRGIFYSGPALQPTIELSSGNFTIGTWGSQAFDNGFQELDFYAGYSFNFGLSVGLTDYYYPTATPLLDDQSHAFELNLGYEIEDFSIAANMILNEATGAASAGGEMYFELGYNLGPASVFIGGGDGWHTTDGEFGLTNIGISTGKEIVITDTFSIPVSAALIINPEADQAYAVVGFSF